MEAHEAVISPHKTVPSSFLIPSIHDGVDIECRIYHPVKGFLHRGAIFAHPYGPLGGSFDDSVVQTIARTLVSEGYTVGTFNFRGVGASKGRTSWSAKPELTDYVSFIGFFVFYMRLCQNNARKSAPTKVEHEAGNATSEPGSTIAGIQLILGGYSYGAMITMNLPPITEILDRFTRISESSIVNRLEKEAYHQTGRKTVSNSDDAEKIKVICSSVPSVSYLLVSPLLPPVSWAIAVPLPSLNLRSRQAQGSTITTKGEISSVKLYEYPTLAVYSDNDQFTAIKKLQRWSTDLQNHEKSQFRCAEIPAAGHFWLSENGLDAMQSRLREWLHAGQESG